MWTKCKWLSNCDIGFPCLFTLHIVVPILVWFLLVFIGVVPFSRNGMTMFFIDLQVHFHVPSF